MAVAENAARQHRYHTLDAMRGVAALLVAAYHLRQRSYEAGLGGAAAGYLAVDLFFALSGFVIALNYTDRFKGRLTVLRFSEMRLIRLFPLYALGLALGLTKLATGRLLRMPVGADIGSVSCAALFGVFMLPDPCSALLFPLNGPSWSLFFELAINLCFALFLWRSSIPMLAILVAVSAASFLYLIRAPEYYNVGWGWHNFLGGAARTVFSFCVGILLFRLLPYRRRRESLAALVPVIGMAMIIGLGAPKDYRVAFEIVAVVLILPGFVVLGCLLETPNGAMRRVFAVLGDLSYPIYAIHFPLIGVVLPILASLHAPVHAEVPLFLVVLVPAAYTAAKLDEAARGRISAALKLRRSASPTAV